MRNRFYIFKFCFILSIVSAFSLTAFADRPNSSPDEKEWTFLIYLNGNNNLDTFGKLNINQMEEVGSTKDLNIIVQWASLKNQKTQRLFITQDNNSQKISSPILQDLGNIDMGDWHSIVDFVQWGVANYPAKHYFIDVWDHGSGWHSFSKGRSKIIPLDISWDDNSGNHITTEQLGQALAESARIIGHKVDLYASDACLMAMAEVADEVADSVQIFAGSEEVEPGAGWPYSDFLKRWEIQPHASAEDVAKMLTEEYVKSYNGGINGNQSATFSAFDLSQIDLLYSSVTKLGKSIAQLDSSSKKKLLSAAKSAQSFTYSDYKDLIDFLNKADAAKISGFEKTLTDEVRQSLGQFIIANATTEDYNQSFGLSIWLPTSMDSYKINSDRYRGLNFHRHTQWGEALRLLLK